MKKTILAGLFLVAVSLTGCSASPDDLMKEILAHMNEYADAAEAKADKAKLDAIDKKIEEKSKKLEEMKLSKEDMKKLAEKHQGEKTLIRYAMAKMGGSMKDLGGLMGGGMPGMPNMPNIPMGPDSGKKK